MSLKFVRYNANPGKKNIGDCAVRAISAGLRMDYYEVCRWLKVSYKNGHGLIRKSGVYLEKIQHMFDEFFDNVENYDSAYQKPSEFDDFHDPFADDEDFDTDGTLNQWADLYRGTGRYLVGLQDPKNRNGSGHIVYVNTNNMKFFDTWDCSGWIVDSFMRINDSGFENESMMDRWVRIYNSWD